MIFQSRNSPCLTIHQDVHQTLQKFKEKSFLKGSLVNIWDDLAGGNEAYCTKLSECWKERISEELGPLSLVQPSMHFVVHVLTVHILFKI